MVGKTSNLWLASYIRMRSLHINLTGEEDQGGTPFNKVYISQLWNRWGIRISAMGSKELEIDLDQRCRLQWSLNSIRPVPTKTYKKCHLGLPDKESEVDMGKNQKQTCWSLNLNWPLGKFPKPTRLTTHLSNPNRQKVQQPTLKRLQEDRSQIG